MNSRVIDDRVLTLAPSGWIYINTFVLFDYETESMWYPFIEEEGARFLCIAGEFAGRRLEVLPVRTMFWPDWVDANPGSKLLK